MTIASSPGKTFFLGREKRRLRINVLVTVDTSMQAEIIQSRVEFCVLITAWLNPQALCMQMSSHSDENSKPLNFGLNLVGQLKI